MVLDTIPAVLAWVPGKTQRTSTSPFLFTVEKIVPTDGDPMTVPIELSWDQAALAVRDPLIPERARRMRSGETAQREHVTELAAYGLAFVALSVFVPGRRVITFRKGLPPDLLFDVTPCKLRGIEVAGRTRGVKSAFKDIRDGSKNKLGKRAQLIARIDVAEAYLSLWCSSPRVGTFWQVKP